MKRYTITDTGMNFHTDSDTNTGIELNTNADTDTRRIPEDCHQFLVDMRDMWDMMWWYLDFMNTDTDTNTFIWNHTNNDTNTNTDTWRYQ